MSRVTKAFRKSRASGSSASAARAAERDDRDSWVKTAVPWHFGDSPAAEDAEDLAKSPVIGDRVRALGDLHGIPHEELNALVQRLLQADTRESRIRSVLFSAVGSSGGSAELCAAVADALASQTTGSVCLIDGNLRSPSLHALFGVTESPGLSDLLVNACDPQVCLTRLRPNLWLLPAGSRCADALPILVAQQIRLVLGGLLDRFDHAVLDTTAASLHGDANVLGPLVDGVVLVIEANATRREVARRTAERLQDANVRLLGAVLTNRTFPIPETIYRKF